MLNRSNEAKIDGNNNLVLQDVSGSTITIHLDDSTAIKEFFIKHSDEVAKLPGKILELLNAKQDLETNLKIGANIYLTVLSAYNMHTVVRIEQKFAVTITNLTKEIRYFNRPYFKTNPVFDSNPTEFDSFIMLDSEKYPIRLEYGEPCSLEFEIKPAALEEFRKINQPESYMEAFCTTTVGELYISNKMNISLIF